AGGEGAARHPGRAGPRLHRAPGWRRDEIPEAAGVSPRTSGLDGRPAPGGSLSRPKLEFADVAVLGRRHPRPARRPVRVQTRRLRALPAVRGAAGVGKSYPFLTD